MRDHRNLELGDAPTRTEITKAVQQHATRHPGSVKRSDASTAKAAAKRAKASRKANR